jgi:hypothetical protein
MRLSSAGLGLSDYVRRWACREVPKAWIVGSGLTWDTHPTTFRCQTWTRFPSGGGRAFKAAGVLAIWDAIAKKGSWLPLETPVGCLPRLAEGSAIQHAAAAPKV